jgi:branched-chain amino acid aminotransferase
MKVWLDGRVVEGSEASIPVTDHGFLYGDGIFEGMRVWSGRLFRFEEHLARLSAGSRAIGLEIPGGLGAVREAVTQTVRAHGEADAYVRLIVTRGEGALGVDPTTCPQPRLLCIVDRVRIYPQEALLRGISLVTSSLRRPAGDALDPRVKSLNYLNNALAKREARLRGADEALLLGEGGRVAEASVANVFAVRRGALATPPASDGALEGIVRGSVLEIAAAEGIPAVERTLGRFDLFAADELFLTGSGAGIVPVASLDGQPIGAGPGPVTKHVRDAFERLARSTGTPMLA